MTASRKKEVDWRLEKYVHSLEERLSELKKSPSCPDNDTLNEYSRRVEFLKGLLQTEKLPSAIEKAMANQLLSAGPVSGSEQLTREIHLQTSSRYTKEMRAELLGEENDGLKQRKKDTTSEDFDTVIRYHQNAQEKLADEMLALARNMKENSLIASSIVKKDIETIEKSTKLTDQNYSKLKVESENLEQHTQKACNWWIWLMLVTVCLTFINMVIFMKIFPKGS